MHARFTSLCVFEADDVVYNCGHNIIILVALFCAFHVQCVRADSCVKDVSVSRAKPTMIVVRSLLVAICGAVPPDKVQRDIVDAVLPKGAIGLL